MAQARSHRRAVDGVLLLDKPLGWSSTRALQRVRWLLGAEKAGHTGTLDPLATGVLPLCFGAATKLAQAALDADKRYRATVRFGVTTTTGDREGEIVHHAPRAIPRAALAAACARFTGAIEQTPPMHSALKHDGKPLYDYARAGVEVERTARAVTIHRLDIVAPDDAAPADRWTVDVTCSKGTYIRVLAEDLGRALGCGAHLDALVRTGSGSLDVADAISLDDLEALAPEARERRLLPPDVLVAGWPRLVLSADDAGRFLTGLRRRIAHADAAHVRVYGPDAVDFLGAGHIKAGELVADRLLSPDEISRLAARRSAASATPSASSASPAFLAPQP